MHHVVLERWSRRESTLHCRDPRAKAELTRVRDQQRLLAAEKQCRLTLMKAEPATIVPSEIAMIAHALVLPTDDPEERQRYDAEVDRQDLMKVDETLAAAGVAREQGATRFCMGAAWRDVPKDGRFDRVLEMVRGVRALHLRPLAQRRSHRARDVARCPPPLLGM